MAGVAQRNTKPELALRRLLHRAGWRYRLHRKGLPGTPDIVFGRLRVVIFVNGCFWHGHGCRLGRLPKSRPKFWGPKIDANRLRDGAKTAQLAQAGWRVMTVWQCALREERGTLTRVEACLEGHCAIDETPIPAALERI